MGEKKRVKRVPVGSGDRIKYSSRPGYVRRLVNDVHGRVKMFQDAGYEFVQGDETGGPPRAGEGSQMGKKISKDVGGGVTAYLMEVPQEWYAEDQALKAEKNDKMEAAMKRPDASAGQYGTVNIE